MITPPGPKGLEVLRVALGRKRDPAALLVELKNRYGDLAHVRVGDTHQFIVSDLAHVKHVFMDNQRNYTKGPAYELLSDFLGKGLVTSEGELWREHRRAVQPALQRDRMHAFLAVMADSSAEEGALLAKKSKAVATVDMFEVMMELTLRIVTRALLGADVSGREAELHAAVTELLDYVERLSASPLRILELVPGGSRLRGLRRIVARLPTRSRRRFRRAVATLDSLIYEIIARRRREVSATAEATDLVSLLLLSRDEAGNEALDDVEIRDEVMTILLAGHETTATALTWCLYLLSLNPVWHRRIALEADEVLGERAATLEDMSQLTSAQWVFEESMRLYPPVWRISRFAKDADRLGEYVVPPGSIIVVSPYLIHRDPAHWENPERFDPTRFSPDSVRGRARLAFLPFGAGQRMCIGATFATVEAQIILSTLCRVVRFEIAPGHDLRIEPRVTLRPRGGMPMRLERIPHRGAAAGTTKQ